MHINVIFLYTNKQTLRGSIFLSSPECSSEVIWSGWLNSTWMFAMAFVPLRPIHLTHLWPRRRISLYKNSPFKRRVSVNSVKSAVSQYRLETGGDKTIVKCVPTIVSVNTLSFRSFFTNHQLSRESQNSQSSISKTKGTVPACPVITCIIARKRLP